jgi:hypothetical protein
MFGKRSNTVTFTQCSRHEKAKIKKYIYLEKLIIVSRYLENNIALSIILLRCFYAAPNMSDKEVLR